MASWVNSPINQRPHFVGTRKPNELGIHDMSGNVSEWCSDGKRKYSKEAQTNPTGPLSGNLRVKRGGAFGDSGDCRVSCRSSVSPTKRSNTQGLRLVLPVEN